VDTIVIKYERIDFSIFTFLNIQDMFTTIGNGKIHYTDSGRGHVVILLHGYLESGEVWNGFAGQLATEFRVITMDLPGHGLSDVYGETHSMEFMASAVKDLLDKLSVGKAFMIGHSLGGYVTLAFLELFPEYLSGYCLFHSQPLSDSPETVEKRLREIAIVKAGKKDLMYPDNVTRMYALSSPDRFPKAFQRSKDIASRIPGEGIIAVLNGMIQRPSRLKIMEEGRVPCLWILGTMDSYIPCEPIQEKVKLPQNATVLVLQNSGHMGFIEESELSVLTLTDFVKRIS
jgi:pimeloyl-ACP methyl ester carboxylesterase